MTQCSIPTDGFQTDLFPSLKRRKVEVDFSGGEISSDGGVLLLRQVDKKLDLLRRAAKILARHDSRQQGKVDHDVRSMLVQRVYGIACAYEDLNDHDSLRHDIAWQTASDRIGELASSPTLCRFENSAVRSACMELSDFLIDIFIESFDTVPDRLVFDFDNTDIELHGHQEGRFFHGYYDEYCFLPLYVFCGEKLVCVSLQPSDRDGSMHAGAILKKIVRKLRAKWPNVAITYRGDSGFARSRHLYWCERNNVDYVVGLARNTVLENILSPLMEKSKEQFEATGLKVKNFSSFEYTAGSWHGRKRNVIGKAEYNEHGSNPRFVLTTLKGDPGWIYNEGYCERGDMENRIKEQQLGLFADRTSAHAWWSNQFRMLLSALAYVLFERMRNLALKGTELAKAQVSTIRLKLLKIGAVIIRNTRRISFSLPSSFPYKNIFWHIASTFSTG